MNTDERLPNVALGAATRVYAAFNGAPQGSKDPTLPTAADSTLGQDAKKLRDLNSQLQTLTAKMASLQSELTKQDDDALHRPVGFSIDTAADAGLGAGQAGGGWFSSAATGVNIDRLSGLIESLQPEDSDEQPDFKTAQDAATADIASIKSVRTQLQTAKQTYDTAAQALSAAQTNYQNLLSKSSTSASRLAAAKAAVDSAQTELDGDGDAVLALVSQVADLESDVSAQVTKLANLGVANIDDATLRQYATLMGDTAQQVAAYGKAPAQAGLTAQGQSILDQQRETADQINALEAQSEQAVAQAAADRDAFKDMLTGLSSMMMKFNEALSAIGRNL